MNTLQDLFDRLGLAPTLETRSASDVPHVRVQMDSGVSYEGALREHTGEMLVLAGVDGALHHLDAGRVEGVTVFDAIAARDVLSGGQEPRFGGSPQAASTEPQAPGHVQLELDMSSAAGEHRAA